MTQTRKHIPSIPEKMKIPGPNTPVYIPPPDGSEPVTIVFARPKPPDHDSGPIHKTKSNQS